MDKAKKTRAGTQASLKGRKTTNNSSNSDSEEEDHDAEHEEENMGQGNQHK